MCFRCMDETLNFKPLTRASPFIYLCIYSFLSDDFPFSGLSAENLRRHSSYYFSVRVILICRQLFNEYN